MAKAYVDRDVVLSYKWEVRSYDPSDPDPVTEVVSVSSIMQTPTADVVERKSGVWIWDDEGYHCSECFFHAYGSTVEILSGDYHFCPHCGAKMDGGQDA